MRRRAVFPLQAGEGFAGRVLAALRQDGIEHPVDELGPPRLEPGQYKAWVTGTTAIGTKLEQESLIQVIELPVRRDADGDHHRQGDPRHRGQFVIDQHGSLEAPMDAVGDSAVGCLVGQSQTGHAEFMALLRSDPRWRASNAYRFMTSLLTLAELDCAD